MKKILVIEDDEDVLDLIKAILTLHEFEVIGLDKTDDVISVVIDYSLTWS